MKRTSLFFPVPVIVVIGAVVLCFAMAAGEAGAVMATPSSWQSIHDGPVDGVGDGFNSDAGLLGRMLAGLAPGDTYQDRLLVEFDLSAFSNQELGQVTLDFEIDPLDATEPAVRAFDIFFYASDGTVELGDFGIAADYLDTIAYTVGQPGSFSIDALAETEDLLAGGDSFIGFRIEPIGSRNPASIIYSQPILNIETAISPVPEPATVLLLGLGAVVLVKPQRP